MTKFFISQPMHGRTAEEIREERRQCEAWLAKAFGAVTVIDSFFLEGAPQDCKNPGLWYLGESLKALSRADVLVMWGQEYPDARGCAIEKQAALLYGIPVIKNGGY